MFQANLMQGAILMYFVVEAGKLRSPQVRKTANESCWVHLDRFTFIGDFWPRVAMVTRTMVCASTRLAWLC